MKTEILMCKPCAEGKRFWDRTAYVKRHNVAPEVELDGVRYWLGAVGQQKQHIDAFDVGNFRCDLCHAVNPEGWPASFSAPPPRRPEVKELIEFPVMAWKIISSAMDYNPNEIKTETMDKEAWQKWGALKDNWTRFFVMEMLELLGPENRHMYTLKQIAEIAELQQSGEKMRSGK